MEPSRVFGRAASCAGVGTCNPRHSHVAGLDRSCGRGIMLPRSVKRNVAFCRFSTAMKVIGIAAYGAALFLVAATPSLGAPHGAAYRLGAHRGEADPWIEGVTPSLENRLFDATYKVLPSHNVLKVYVFDAAGYQSAGIRFSARVPHEPKDLPEPELDREAAALIRTTFDLFPQIQALDVWATIPVAKAQATEIDSTVYSVSADRKTYDAIRNNTALNDEAFLAAFGQIWTAPEVPQ